MNVSELITILNSYNKNSNIIIYDDCTDSSYDISCIDIDENEECEDNPNIVIFI